MIIKKPLIALCVSTPLIIGAIVYVAAMPTTFEQDVKAGNAQLSNDSVAFIQANKLKDNEKLEGQVDNIKVQVNQTAGQQTSSTQETDTRSSANHDNASVKSSHDNSLHKNRGETDNTKSVDTTKRNADHENN